MALASPTPRRSSTCLIPRRRALQPRSALGDARLVDFDGESVTLRYKDYRDGARGKVMILSGEALLRRFLLHGLPKGLMRVRHYGFLANRCRARRLPEIRAALAAPPAATAQAEEAGACVPFDGYPCPKAAPAGCA